MARRSDVHNYSCSETSQNQQQDEKQQCRGIRCMVPESLQVNNGNFYLVWPYDQDKGYVKFIEGHDGYCMIKDDE